MANWSMMISNLEEDVHGVKVLLPLAAIRPLQTCNQRPQSFQSLLILLIRWSIGIDTDIAISLAINTAISAAIDTAILSHGYPTDSLWLSWSLEATLGPRSYNYLRSKMKMYHDRWLVIIWRADALTALSVGRLLQLEIFHAEIRSERVTAAHKHVVTTTEMIVLEADSKQCESSGRSSDRFNGAICTHWECSRTALQDVGVISL